MLVNGRLPDSILAPVPGGARMRKDAAAHLAAENFRLRAQGRGTVMANGSLSGYRNFAGQVTMRTSWCARGRCGNAAVPGTSNHGWGIAIDTNQGYLLDGHGGPFDKAHSDAPWESWHRVDGTVSRTSYVPPKPPWKPKSAYPTLKRGNRASRYAPAVKRLQRLLRRCGRHSVVVDGDFGPKTRAAVKGFKVAHHLPHDSVVGKRTWAALRRQARHPKRGK